MQIDMVTVDDRKALCRVSLDAVYIRIVARSERDILF